MTTEQLPKGLQQAVELLDGDRDSFISSQVHPTTGLSRDDEVIATEYLTAIEAIHSERAQRLTLQHHACDQAQRIADLETKCVTLKRLHDAAADERDALRTRLAEIEAQAVSTMTREDAALLCEEVSSDLTAAMIRNGYSQEQADSVAVAAKICASEFRAGYTSAPEHKA